MTDDAAVSYEHFEIIEYLHLSEETAEELADELTDLTLIENRSYGGFMIVQHHAGGRDD